MKGQLSWVTNIIISAGAVTLIVFLLGLVALLYYNWYFSSFIVSVIGGYIYLHFMEFIRVCRKHE
jgi:hypothetical protein